MGPVATIVCHDARPMWVSWGYVIRWPGGRVDMRMGLRSWDAAAAEARAMGAEVSGGK